MGRQTSRILKSMMLCINYINTYWRLLKHETPYKKFLSRNNTNLQQKHVRQHKSTDFNFHHILKEKLTFNGMLPHQICLQKSSQIFPRLFQLHFSVFSLSSPAIVAFGWRLLRTFGWEGNQNQNDGLSFGLMLQGADSMKMKPLPKNCLAKTH